jgi:hypothetical protein
MENIKTYAMSQEILWITMINSGYILYTKNFLESLKVNNIDMKLIVFCMDEQNVTELKNEYNDYCIPILIDFLDNNKYSDNLELYGDLEYKKIVFAKLDTFKFMLKSLTESNINCHVGYIDTDIVILKNINKYILEIMNKFKDCDAFFQCDEATKSCTNIFTCINPCSGVFVLRNKAYFLKLLNYDLNYISMFEGDQDYLKYIFIQNKIKYITFNKVKIMNGGYNTKLATMYIDLTDNTLLLHFNYMIGDEKRKSMIINKKWYLK